MPLAVTHVLLTIILVGLYRDHVTKHKHYFSLYTVFVAGVAGLLPDIDFPLRLLNDFSAYPLLQHGGFFHTPFFGLLFLIPGLYFLKREKHKVAMYFFAICFGVLFHIFLDWFLGGGGHLGLMLLWPLSSTGFEIGLLSSFGMKDLPVALDALILLGWLFYIEVKHKISDFV